MISVIDHGSGNVGALLRVAKLGAIEMEVISSPEEVSTRSRLLLPGVSAADSVMKALTVSGLARAITQRVEDPSVFLLGICVGMHILADSSDEGSTECLGLIGGTVRSFDKAHIHTRAKVPHMGWNSVKADSLHPLLADVDLERGFYFLHGYYFDASDAAHVVGTTTHGRDFDSIVGNGRVFGTQFHPEKSHQNGIALIRNFDRLATC